jgi:hypothetical protein
MIRVKSETELEIEQEEVFIPEEGEIPATSIPAHIKKVEERYSDPEVKKFYEGYYEETRRAHPGTNPLKKRF